MRAALPALASSLEHYDDAVFGLSSGFFYLPAAQAEAWGVTDDVFQHALLRTLALGHFHFAWQDQVVDEGIADPVMCLLSDSALLGYLDSLNTLADTRSRRYRNLHESYYARYAAAVARDLRHRAEVAPYDADDVLGLGDKAAPGATVIHLVADVAGVRTRGASAASALLRLCAGLQLLDDLADAAHDARAGNLTWPVTAALQAYPELAPDDGEGIRAAVQGSGVAGACLRLAAEAFEDAHHRAAQAGAHVLEDLAGVWARRCAQRLKAQATRGLPNLARETS
jgi:hypothetical protein